MIHQHKIKKTKKDSAANRARLRSVNGGTNRVCLINRFMIVRPMYDIRRNESVLAHYLQLNLSRKVSESLFRVSCPLIDEAEYLF